MTSIYRFRTLYYVADNIWLPASGKSKRALKFKSQVYTFTRLNSIQSHLKMIFLYLTEHKYIIIICILKHYLPKLTKSVHFLCMAAAYLWLCGCEKKVLIYYVSNGTQSNHTETDTNGGNTCNKGHCFSVLQLQVFYSHSPHALLFQGTNALPLYFHPE